jgi:hypothetical protein
MNMKIVYEDGTVVEGFLLSNIGTIMRAAVKGCDESLEIENLDGGWQCEKRYPVQVRFEWESGKLPEVPSETDCICSKELASRLIQSLETGDDDQVATPRLAA